MNCKKICLLPQYVSCAMLLEGKTPQTKKITHVIITVTRHCSVIFPAASSTQLGSKHSPVSPVRHKLISEFSRTSLISCVLLITTIFKLSCYLYFFPIIINLNAFNDSKTNNQHQILSVTTCGIVSRELLDDDASVSLKKPCSKPLINSSENWKLCPSKNG